MTITHTYGQPYKRYHILPHFPQWKSYHFWASFVHGDFILESDVEDGISLDTFPSLSLVIVYGAFGFDSGIVTFGEIPIMGVNALGDIKSGSDATKGNLCSNLFSEWLWIISGRRGCRWEPGDNKNCDGAAYPEANVLLTKR